MISNYLFLKRAAAELNEIFAGEVIYDIYTQEKNKLYLHIPSDEFEYRHLIISLDPSLPYLQIKNDHRKAKKNIVSFFSSSIPTKTSEFSIAEKDRIIRINTYNVQLFFMIRGGKTNLILLNEEDKSIQSVKTKNFKDPQSIYNELQETNFVDPKEDYKFSITPDTKLNALKKHLPFVNKEFINLLEILKPNYETISELLETTFDVFQNGNIGLFYDSMNSKARFFPNCFIFENVVDEVDTYDDYMSAVNKYVSLKYRNESTTNITGEIENYLDKELGKLSSKLNKLKRRIEEGSKEEYYRYCGKLLLNNIYQLKKGDKKFVATDYETEKEVEIKLDPKKTPNDNVDLYFEKSKDEKINYEKSKELFEISYKNYKQLLSYKNEIDDDVELDRLKEISKELKLNKKVKSGNKLEENIKYWHYLIEGKYNVYVGRDSKNNDLLTVKFAKQNDYWFHARGLPGSHVILRVDNTKEVIPKHILKLVSSIAAYYSKAKTAGTVPVAYTLNKFVTKRKGMAPGKVMIMKEKVLLVKPEIPASAELITE